MSPGRGAFRPGPAGISCSACASSTGSGTGSIKNGGRVMKNVTGYDLVKLMAGSWGTLGVLSEVSAQGAAGAERRRDAADRGLSDGRGGRGHGAALGSPFEVTGAAHTPRGRTARR
jgi:glycolate oxidase FAD binding subunit